MVLQTDQWTLRSAARDLTSWAVRHATHDKIVSKRSWAYQLSVVQLQAREIKVFENKILRVFFYQLGMWSELSGYLLYALS